MVALAPNYLVYLIGRSLIGVVIGGFWSMSAAAAMRLVPSHQVPRALAIFNGGNALATVVAPPLGAYLGSVMGWRGAFFCLVPVAVIVLVWQWVSLPSMESSSRSPGSGNVFRVLKSRHVSLGMAACGAFFMGQFALFTYVRPFLETVTHVEVSTLSLILLVVGVTGLVGTALIGSILHRSLYGTLIAIPILMAAIAVALILFGPWVTSVAALPTKASRPGTVRNGDLMLYGSQTLVVFYLTFDSSYTYTSLGRVDDPTGLAEALGRDDVQIKFSKDPRS